MPSLVSTLVRTAAWVMFYSLRKRETQQGTLDLVVKDLGKQSAPPVFPSDLDAREESMNLVANQKWQVYHQASKDGQSTSETVVLFWHGGGFINNVSGLRGIGRLSIRMFYSCIQKYIHSLTTECDLSSCFTTAR